jgi:hemolysin activation/secretion protein
MAWGGGLLLAAALATPPMAQADAPPPTPAERTFDVEAYDVDGVSMLRPEDVEDVVYPFVGPDRTRADIEGARQALEKAYRDRGYSTVVVDLPAQTVADNIVRIHVVEATVGRLRVTGARYFSPEAIKAEAAAFQEGGVPNINQAQTELAELNRAADRRVTPVLKAGTVPGTVDVDLKVTDTLPLHASVELNNDHNQYTTPLRTLATVHYDNLWQLQHSISFTFATAPENMGDSEIFAGSYLAPVPRSPFSLMVFGYDSNSNVATLGGTTVLGKGYSVGFRAVDQLPRVHGWAQTLSLGFDFKDFDENIQVETTAASSDVIGYWPLTAAYTAARDGDKFSTKASLSVTVGTRGLGSNTADFENKRFDARPEFVHVNLDFTQTEALGLGVTASQHLLGQIADGPLVSSEEFAAGGFTSVRGYLQSEAVGDDGVTGAFEFISPSLAPRWAAAVDDLRLFTFFDGGALRVQDPLAGQASSFSLASVGGGLRVTMLRHIKADVALALPLISGAATRANHPRATFSLKSDF